MTTTEELARLRATERDQLHRLTATGLEAPVVTRMAATRSYELWLTDAPTTTFDQ
jgi:hypothetical protein